MTRIKFNLNDQSIKNSVLGAMKSYVAVNSLEPKKSNGEAPIKDLGHFKRPPEADNPDIRIELDSKLGKWLGFTSDKFSGYLWKKNNEIYISFIVSEKPNEGNLSRLFQTILDQGWTIKVPTPFLMMQSILVHKGFKHTTEFDNRSCEDVEVWEKKPYDMEANRQQSNADS